MSFRVSLKPMQFRNTTERWGALSQLVHWLIVALILAQYVLARIAEDLPLGNEKIAALARHKSVGITILVLAVLRLLWRWRGAVPPMPATARPYEQTSARVTHVLLYALLFLQPLTGWMMSSALNFPVSWFGLVQLPDLVSPSHPLFDFFHGAHEMLFNALCIIALLHAAAALRHHFVLKDDVLRRMLPKLAACGLLVASALPTSAAPRATAYVGEQAEGSLTFTFEQAGAKTSGRFERYDVQLTLDPAKPEVGRFAVTVDVGSLDTDSDERDRELRGEDLFDVANHPRATFVATQIAALGKDRYEAQGRLTIRGVERPVTLPFTLRSLREGASATTRLQGSVTIRRLDFGVGQVAWQSTEYVGNDVDVKFDVPLRPTAAAGLAPATVSSQF